MAEKTNKMPDKTNKMSDLSASSDANQQKEIGRVHKRARKLDDAESLPQAKRARGEIAPSRARPGTPQEANSQETLDINELLRQMESMKHKVQTLEAENHSLRNEKMELLKLKKKIHNLDDLFKQNKSTGLSMAFAASKLHGSEITSKSAEMSTKSTSVQNAYELQQAMLADTRGNPLEALVMSACSRMSKKSLRRLVSKQRRVREAVYEKYEVDPNAPLKPEPRELLSKEWYDEVRGQEPEVFRPEEGGDGDDPGADYIAC